MNRNQPRFLPPDQPARELALGAARSVLVQAPAGSGKTDLLTRRFLRLLAEVDEPGQIVAITFTKAAAAEMRHRILGEIEKAAAREPGEHGGEIDEFQMETLAARALEQSRGLGWNLIEMPSQLRIMTIDAFCRELALQQPLLSGLGSGLEIFQDPETLYRRAAQRTLGQIDTADAELRGAIETLLLWRDNGWQEMEELLAKMLAQRDRWMQGFVFESEQDWGVLRERLERPFACAAREQLFELSALLDLAPSAREEAMELARFACAQPNGAQYCELAELAEFPLPPFESNERLEEAHRACAGLAELLLTKTDSAFRKQINATMGFPPDCKEEKARLAALIQEMKSVAGLGPALAAVRELPSLRYSEDDWKIIRASFILLRRTAAELNVVFAEAGAVDYIEVAQIAQNVLRGEDGEPAEGALAAADGIRHLLVDEFQDTSRKQHELLRRLIAAWPEREGRTCFVVGDPMQSIYSFRDAEVELFSRVNEFGFEIPDDLPLKFDSVSLTANFRSAAPLVARLNDLFETVFEEDDGSGVGFTPSEPARQADAGLHLVRAEEPRLALHPHFMPAAQRGGSVAAEEKRQVCEGVRDAETDEIVALIRTHEERMEAARAAGRNYRIAILGRARTALVPVADALRDAQIPFRAVELERLGDQPEILDALALLRALMNPLDRVAWLGVLRAPWCCLSLADLHTLVSADDPELMVRPVRDLLIEREALVCSSSRQAVQRVLRAVEFAGARRANFPEQTLGTWLEQTWLRIGGADCVDQTARANLDQLWKCLDSLPDGECDVLGRALDVALDKLTGLPDPNADTECGVQLMTIHKAKGLEFEVVILPELQARGGRTGAGLLSWLERGLREPDESGEITEFLIAPLPSKGSDSGATRKWVDRVRATQEKQEMRRILYVAATRAREELHLFARLAYKSEANGLLTLVDPAGCLLATAWKELAQDARQQFEAWQATVQPGRIESLAAEGADIPLEAGEVVKGARRGVLLHRLPADYELAKQGSETTAERPGVISGLGRLYERHEGGLLSRAFGMAVHKLLEELARLRETEEWNTARYALAKMESRVTARIRGLGVEKSQAFRIASQALEVVLAASRDPLGEWIMSPRADAASEVSWTGVVGSVLRTVRVDRVFKADSEPQSDGGDTWWVIDYKTAVAFSEDAVVAMASLRPLFAPQLEAYARVMRNLHGAEARICGGLYYPRMMKFDWWEM